MQVYITKNAMSEAGLGRPRRVTKSFLFTHCCIAVFYMLTLCDSPLDSTVYIVTLDNKYLAIINLLL